MNSDGKERRKFSRVLFSIEDGVVGVFTLSGNKKESIAAFIFDLSTGGLHFILSRDENKGFSNGDHLTLSKIRGKTSLQFIADIEIEIKWILDHQYVEHIGLGCEFKNLPEAVRDQIGQFVDMCFAGREKK